MWMLPFKVWQLWDVNFFVFFFLNYSFRRELVENAGTWAFLVAKLVDRFVGALLF